jgi:hypothetical protein
VLHAARQAEHEQSQAIFLLHSNSWNSTVRQSVLDGTRQPVKKTISKNDKILGTLKKASAAAFQGTGSDSL